MLRQFGHTLRYLRQRVIGSPIRRAGLNPMLFARDYLRYTGGQQKVRDYFQHVLSSKVYDPWIFLTRQSNPDLNQLWTDQKGRVITRYDYKSAAALFLAGPDWRFLPGDSRGQVTTPRINLIQDFWATEPKHDLHQYLTHPAIRVCVSETLSEAIRATGRANGPVITIPNGIDLNLASPEAALSDRSQVTIFGHKSPSFAQELGSLLRQEVKNIRVLTEPMPRLEMFRQYAKSLVSVLLPYPAEGFFLPAIEAMASRSVVVVPDCIGNRPFCINGYNSIVPEYTVEAVFSSVRKTLSLPSIDLEQLVSHAIETAREHSLAREREDLLSLLNQLPELWEDAFQNGHM